MRLTSFGIVFILMMSFLAGQASAQIPERTLFQPGSYAYGPYYAGNVGVASAALLPAATLESEEELGDVAKEDAVKIDEADKNEWEETFGTEGEGEEDAVFEFEEAWGEAGMQAQPKTETVPYLAYHRDPWTHRIHVVPYEPGYAAEPETFPVHYSKLNVLLSTLPCREDNRKQVTYASYYDPDPVIIEDKPSRLQLILGYPNGAWTSCCKNRWGDRMAQCPGVEVAPLGPYAEIGVKDQSVIHVQPGLFGGLFAGPRPMDYAAQPRRGFRGLRAAYPASYPIYPQYYYQYAEQYQIAEQNQEQLSVPYPPYTAHSSSRSRFGFATTLCQCPECVLLNEKNEKSKKIEAVCTCHDREKICDSHQHCQSCHTCHSCKLSGKASCESTVCHSCGIAKPLHRPLKKVYVKKATVPYSTKVVSKAKASCSTKTEEEEIEIEKESKN